MKKKIEKIKNVIKTNKPKSIIVGVVITFILIIGGIILVNNNFEYMTKRNELLELGSTSYQSENVFVKNKTLDDMDTLIVTTETNLNEELESLLSECTVLEVECVINEDLVLDIKNTKSVLQTKVDEVNKKALDLKLDTSKVLNNQELNYVNKVSEINKMIDTENKRLDEVKKAEEEKKAQELAEQQAQELAMVQSSDSSTSTGASTSQNTNNNTSTSSGTSSGSSSNSSSGSSTSSGGSYNCGGTMVADQKACEDLFNNLGEIEQPDYAVCSNPPGGYFCSKDEAHNAGNSNFDYIHGILPEVDSYSVNPEEVNGYMAYRVIYIDYDSGHSYDMYGNQVD